MGFKSTIAVALVSACLIPQTDVAFGQSGYGTQYSNGHAYYAPPTRDDYNRHVKAAYQEGLSQGKYAASPTLEERAAAMLEREAAKKQEGEIKFFKSIELFPPPKPAKRIPANPVKFRQQQDPFGDPLVDPLKKKAPAQQAAPLQENNSFDPFADPPSQAKPAQDDIDFGPVEIPNTPPVQENDNNKFDPFADPPKMTPQGEQPKQAPPAEVNPNEAPPTQFGPVDVPPKQEAQPEQKKPDPFADPVKPQETELPGNTQPEVQAPIQQPEKTEPFPTQQPKVQEPEAQKPIEQKPDPFKDPEPPKRDYPAIEYRAPAGKYRPPREQSLPPIVQPYQVPVEQQTPPRGQAQPMYQPMPSQPMQTIPAYTPPYQPIPGLPTPAPAPNQVPMSVMPQQHAIVPAPSSVVTNEPINEPPPGNVYQGVIPCDSGPTCPSGSCGHDSLFSNCGANPEGCPNFYFGAFGGWSFMDDLYDSTNNQTIDSENGSVFGFAFGRRNGRNLRTELELAFRSNNVTSLQQANLNMPLDGDIKCFSGMANAYWEMINVKSRCFKPYVGIGVGFASLTADIRDASGASIIPAGDDNDTSFAFQAMAGVNYKAYRNMDLYTEYRYFEADTYRLTTTGVGSGRYDYQPSSLILGLRWKY